jgi:hypothetical protein
VDELTLDSDVYAAVLCRLPSGTCNVAALNGVTPDVRDTVPYNTDVVVLPVPASWLGLSSSSTKFNYSRGNASTPQVHTFDLAHPGLYFGGTDYLGATATQPLYDDLDGQVIQVTYKQADYTTDAALGMLLLHHHNGAGSRAQVLGQQFRPPRKHLQH